MRRVRRKSPIKSAAFLGVSKPCNCGVARKSLPRIRVAARSTRRPIECAGQVLPCALLPDVALFRYAMLCYALM